MTTRDDAPYRERVRAAIIKAVVDVLQEHEPCEAPDVYDAATMRIGEWIADRAADQITGEMFEELVHITKLHDLAERAMYTASESAKRFEELALQYFDAKEPLEAVADAARVYVDVSEGDVDAQDALRRALMAAGR